jgi:hypothetical protein
MARKKRGGRGKARGGAVTLADLKRMLEQKTAEIDALRERREELAGELAAVDAALTLEAGGKRGPGRPRKNFGIAPAPKRRKGGRGKAKKAAKRGNGRKARGGKRGPRGEGGLQNMIRKVLGAGGGEPMKLADVAEKVLAEGYQTGSSRFGVIVGQRLSEMNDVKKAGRGMYVLK